MQLAKGQACYGCSFFSVSIYCPSFFGPVRPFFHPFSFLVEPLVLGHPSSSLSIKAHQQKAHLRWSSTGRGARTISHVNKVPSAFRSRCSLRLLLLCTPPTPSKSRNAEQLVLSGAPCMPNSSFCCPNMEAQKHGVKKLNMFSLKACNRLN